MNKLHRHIGLLSVALAMNPKLLEQLNNPFEVAENTKEANPNEFDRERIEAAKNKRLRKLERNKPIRL